MDKPLFTQRWTFFGRERKRANVEGGEDMRCSFCNKSHVEVKKLIAGPTVFICDECIQVCNDILEDDIRFGRVERQGQSMEPPPPTPAPTTRIVTCVLCHLQLPWEDATAVAERGALCLGCIAAIEAAIAQKRESAT
jgi:hypothetical protein